MPACSSSHSSRPGSTLPERVAITRPSSGVKPIVVSTRAPVAHGGQRRAGAEVAGDDPQPGRGQRRARRGARVREAVESVAPERPALAPRGGDRVGARGRREPGVEGGVEARHRRQPRARRRAPRASAASDFGWCSGASAVSSLAGRARPSSSITAARGSARRRARPGGRPRRRRRARRAPRPSVASPPAPGRACASSSSPSPSSAQLEAARAGVDDEDPHPASVRPAARSSRGPPAGRRRARACTRARAGARRPSPGAARPRACPRPGTRSITSMTRWKRSRSLSMTMSNGVVVVPSSL